MAPKQRNLASQPDPEPKPAPVPAPAEGGATHGASVEAPRTSYRALHAASTNALAWLEPLLAMRDAMAEAADAEGYVTAAQATLSSLQDSIVAANATLAHTHDLIAQADAALQARLTEARESAAETRTTIQREVQAAREAASAEKDRIARETDAAIEGARRDIAAYEEHILSLKREVRALEVKQEEGQRAVEALAALGRK